MLAAKGKLYVGHHNKLCVIDTATKTRISWNAHSIPILSMTICDNLLFSNSLEEIKLWNIDSRQCIATIHLEEEGYSRIQRSIGFSGKRLFVQTHRKFWILDFTANHKTILEEIANLMETDSHKLISIAIERFSRLPEHVKKKIYIEFNQLIKDRLPMNLEHIEDPFLNLNGFFSTPQEKARAIRNYLASLNPLALPLELEKEFVNNPNQ